MAGSAYRTGHRIQAARPCRQQKTAVNPPLKLLTILGQPFNGKQGAATINETMHDAPLQLASEVVTVLVAEQNNILAQHAQRVLVLASGRLV